MQLLTRGDYQCDAITKWGRTKRFVELGIMLHDFQIMPQSRRISSITFNPRCINVAAQHAKCVRTAAPERTTSTLRFVRSNRGMSSLDASDPVTLGLRASARQLVGVA